MCKTRRAAKLALCVPLILSWGCVWLPLAAQDADRASKVYAEAAKSVLLLLVRSEKGEVIGQGTGFVVTGGKIVTNEHVVRNGQVFIDLGAARLPAAIERVDAFNDLALLTAGAELAVNPLIIADVSPAPGTSIFAIGNPAGLERSISTGVVSGIRDLKGRQLLQITAPISPGSSGGPILNARGEVVAVAVGMLEKGQNLNFAVPATQVRRLLTGEVQASADISSLLSKVESLTQRRAQYEYAAEPDSDWQKLDRQIDTVLQSALDRAGNDSDLLLKIAEQAEIQNTEIAIAAAERAVQAKPTAEGHLILAKSLKLKAAFAEDTEKGRLLERAEKAMRSALRVSKQPAADIYYHFADVLEDRGSYVEAESNFRRALDLSKTSSDPDLQANSLRGLVRTTYSQGKQAESDSWFEVLVEVGKVNAWDWQQNGSRLDAVRRYREAGQSYRQAAFLGGAWTNWCEAAGSFALTDGEDEAVLFCARRCVAEGSGKKDSESRLGNAHRQIANILNERGVYQEALSHAREASALNASDAWAYDAQAEALLGLRRFQEAINASNQAIRLSDGKYSTMHFKLGSAYFDVENWEFARQSFEKAAQLNPKDSAAPYNVALCLVRLGYYRDAAIWYEEVLRRDPNHRNREEILSRIQVLRR